MKLVDLLKGVVCLDSDRLGSLKIENLTYDSRKVKEGSCFVAIRGENFDGHEFISEAIDRGANLIISENKYHNQAEIPVIVVDNSRKALSKLASNFYGNPSSKINLIGITGTNGKTSITQIIKQLLDSLGSSCGSLGTLGFSINQDIVNTGFTTPESIELHGMLSLLVDSSTKNAVLEVSSHSLDQRRVDDVDFNIGIFTNLSQDHLDYHKTMRNYFNAKSKLFKNLGADSYSIINTDDTYGLELYSSVLNNKISYGIKRDADISASNIRFSFEYSSAKIKIFNKEYLIKTNLMGEYNVSNILAAIAALTSLGYEPKDIIDKINNISFSIPGRVEVVSHIDDKFILVDYAHSPDAFKTIFSNIKKIDNSFSLISLFGCGGNRDKTKRPEMARIAEQYCDMVFVTSDNPRNEKLKDINDDIVSGFSSDCYDVIENRSDAIKKAISAMNEKSVLLILGKGRENYQIIGSQREYHSDIDIVREYVYAN